MKPYKKKFIESVSKSLIKYAPDETSFERFCTSLKTFIEKVNSSIKNKQLEGNLKGHLEKFLLESFYKDTNVIEQKSYIGNIEADLAIFQTDKNNSPVEVLIEVKKPGNKGEMISLDNLNRKALHEAVFYYLFEKVECKNNELKHLIITNLEELYIFDAQDIEKVFYYEGKSGLGKDFIKWKNKTLDNTNTSLFYSIVEFFMSNADIELPFAHIDLRSLASDLPNIDKENSRKNLIQAYKILCPHNLLKKPVSNDSNTLNREFYDELLHIIGLEEKPEKGKKLIQRKPIEKRNEGSFIEDLMDKLKEGEKLDKINYVLRRGNTEEERFFNIALELSLTWINRILFLKLLEAQLFKYHSKDEYFKFLNLMKIHSWSDLRFLFFKVLAIKERKGDLKGFDYVPYLNSSLFEMTELEREITSIDYLTQDAKIPVSEKTVLKDSQDKKLKNIELTTLEYLLKFLSAYDFGVEDSEDTKKESKTIINASVLGLIFEKINGYKDGSFFTPGYITMYMCRETIRRTVLDKFNQKYELNCQSIEELNKEIYRNRISEIEANELINNLRICDPAVGSGHFLVSALNEIISIKSDLDILIDTNGKQLGKYYKAYVENDELLIIDLESNESFDYKVASFDKNQGSRQVGLEKTRVQKTIFHEKQKIIENCLFGVDINPNSVQICRLRLWIELLKNAYYIPETNYLKLQTLPNIDINIKQGNSLISRHSLDEHLNESKISETVKDYLKAVQEYKNSTDKIKKEELTKRIEAIKEGFHVDLFKNNKAVAKKNKKISDLNKLHQRLQGYSSNLLGSVLSESDLKKRKKEENNLKKEIEKAEIEIDTLESQIQEVKEGQIYKTGFEWRFEFPEVLDEKGDFVGFDIIIGNPPYGVKLISREKEYLKNRFTPTKGEIEIYTFFIELSMADLLKQNGVFSFITTNTIYYLDKFSQIRKNAFLGNRVISLLELEKQVFADASDIVPAIYVLQKNVINKNVIELYKSTKTKRVYDLVKFEGFKVSSIEQNKFETKTDYVFSLSTNEAKENLLKRVSHLEPIKKSFKVVYGIKTGNNERFLSKEVKGIENWKKCASSAKNIKKYTIDWQGDYLNVCSDLAGLNNINYEQPKILIQYIRKLSMPARLVCTLDSNGEYYPLNNFSFVISENGNSLKVLLGILNSQLMNWYFSNSFVDYNIKPKYIEQLPLPKEIISSELEAKVTEIISLKVKDKEIDTTNLEKEIDLMVYKLYGLTAEEAKIVDPTLTDSELALIGEKA